MLPSGTLTYGDDNNLPATSPGYTRTVRGLTNLAIEGSAIVAAGTTGSHPATATFSDAVSVSPTLVGPDLAGPAEPGPRRRP